ncbi:MAG: four helix bundle protein [Sedimentisphaerales bacterium]
MQNNDYKENPTIKTYRDLIVYQLSYKLAMEIFEITKKFPKEEIYSIVTQIRKSSRSVPANIAEGWAKRRYENVFIRHLNDSNGSCEETKVWLDFSKDCKYILIDVYTRLLNEYNRVGAMLNSLMDNWETFQKE